MTSLTVSPISSHNIERLQDAWNEEDFKAIIELLDGELAGLELSEIEEYMNMLISDADVPESAYQVLKSLSHALLTSALKI